MPAARKPDVLPSGALRHGYTELFNGKLRDELINREVFTALLEAKILIERLHFWA